MNRIAAFATILILAHLVVATLHGVAHQQLGVGLELWQQVFVVVVITVAPLVALALYWTRYQELAALLLWTSMAGSLAFGVYHHFVAVSSDHVNHLPEGDAQGLFIVTAINLVLLEALGAGLGFWDWTRRRRAAEQSSSDER